MGMVRMEEPAPFPRASFFVACRLASVVQKFRQRLQEKVQQKKKSPNPFGVSYHRGIRLRALSDLERSAPPCRLTVTEEPRSAVEHQNHGRWINGMLRDLNIHSNSPTFSLTHIAADDKLLLSHTQQDLIEKLAQHATLPQAAYMFDSSTFLISRLEKLQLDKVKKWADADADCKRLKEDAYIANLLHLLRRLQYLLFQVLVHRSISCLDEFASHWQTYWQQQKKLGEDWFTEWPSGRRPLSTTWPWNIRPSLVVLWGVCWMFYRSDQNNEDNPRSPAQQLVDESANWQLIFTGPELEQARDFQANLSLDTSSLATGTTSVQAFSRTSPDSTSTLQAAIGQNLNFTSGRPLSAGAQPQHPYHSGYYPPLPLQVPASGGLGATSWPRPQLQLGITQEIPSQAFDSTSLAPGTYYPPPFRSSHSESRDHHAGWPTSISGDTANAYVRNDQLLSNVWPVFSQQGPPPIHQTSPNVPSFQISPVEGQSQGLIVDSTLAQNPRRPLLQPPFVRQQEMGSTDVYPMSPQSERGRQGSITTPTSQAGSLVADTTPSTEGSKGLQISVKRGDPPRNDEGKIYCAHPDCAKDVLNFRRPCEWNKHMDKHERPYKCNEPGCDKVQGFTYSGGLLRHQREVHKKNTSPGRELYCQYPNCNRSKSRPFTRQENLTEHVRRRHVESAVISPATLGGLTTAAAPATPAIPPQDRSRKRKRTVSTDFDDEAQSRDADSDEEEYSEQVKRLKRTIRTKEDGNDQLRGTISMRDNESDQLRGMVTLKNHEIVRLRMELDAVREQVAALQRSVRGMDEHTLPLG